MKVEPNTKSYAVQFGIFLDVDRQSKDSSFLGDGKAAHATVNNEHFIQVGLVENPIISQGGPSFEKIILI